MITENRNYKLKNAGNHRITTRDKMITAFLIGALLFLAAFMINIYIICRF